MLAKPEGWFRRHLLAKEDYAFASVAVSADDYSVIGYCIIERTIDGFMFRRISVLPRWQRLGVGTSLVTHYKCAVASNLRKFEAVVRESHIGTQLFFNRQGFKWQETVPSRFKLPETEDGYRLIWRG